MQTYDLGGVELWHADLYRLGLAGGAGRARARGGLRHRDLLVEWADRLGAALPARALMLHLDFLPETDHGRRARLDARGGGWDWLPGVLAGAAA